MKKTYLIGACAALSLNANAELGPSGLSGELSLLVIYQREETNFDTDREQKSSPLNSAGEADSDFTPVPLGQLRYTFGNQNTQQLFVGTAKEDIVAGLFALEIGYAVEVSQGSNIAISLLPSIVSGETWEDPFLIDQDRKVTDVTGNAYRLQYHNILGSAFSAEIAYYDREIEEEQSGQDLTGEVIDTLRRDGSGLYSQARYRLPIGEASYVEPALIFNQFDADGSAESNTGYGFGFTYGIRLKNQGFALSGRYLKAEFDERNPVFSETREDNEYELNLAYQYGNLFGYPNLGFTGLIGLTEKDSNVNFYDESGYFGGIGVSYRF